MENRKNFEANFEAKAINGYSWTVAGLVTAGDLVGAGFVSLPTATVQTQFYPGIALILILGAMFIFTSDLLGHCWVILLKRWPEYYSHSQPHCRNPYAEIGKRALGHDIGIFVSAVINVTQFGICVVYLLMAAKYIQDFAKTIINIELSFCYVILIVGFVMLPLILLKSPKDFWMVMLAAMVSTLLAAILITIGAVMDYETCHNVHETPRFTFINYFLALGTIFFAYGGHAAYPTIQHDMKKPHEWKKSSALGYAIAICMYVPPCVCAFGIRRVQVRFIIMLAAIFVAESVPSVEPMMNIVGSTGIAIVSTIFPALFYLYLNVGHIKCIESPNFREQVKHLLNGNFFSVLAYTPRKTLICCFIVILIGIIGGFAATYTAIQQLSHEHLVPPCYLSPLIKNSSRYTINVGATNCCGHWQNITRYNITCSKPDMSYYH